MLYFIVLLLNQIFGKIIQIPIADYRVIISIAGISNTFVPSLRDSCSFIDSVDLPIPSVYTIIMENLKYKVKENEYECKLIQFIIDLKEIGITFNNFTFAYSISQSLYYPRLALSYGIDEYSSITHHAFKKGYINRLCFSMTQKESPKGDGMITLGGIPEEYSDYKMASCDVVKNNKNWGCIIDSIYFFDYEYNKKQYIYFDLYSDDNGIKTEFKDYFDNVMKEEKSSIQREDGFYHLKYKFGNYLIIIENGIRVYNGNTYLNLITKEDFIFGEDMFRNFTPLFDYQMSKIFIYGEDNIEDFKGLISKIYKYITFTNILILLINIFNLLLRKITISNKSNITN